MSFVPAFVPAGLIPSLIVLVLIASLGGDEFKITEVIFNMVVLSILCIIVFKVGLQMNISVLRGVW
jgi:NhaP-type Na+/H+ or K+/H+ antiporter